MKNVQQDTTAIPQQRPDRILPDIAVPKLQLDLERAEEVFKQFEQREQDIVDSQNRTVLIPRAKREEVIRKPSVEVDPLMAKYFHIGSSPRANFPDTFTLTVLERYYQPMPPAMATTDATDVLPVLLPVSSPDSLQTLIPAVANPTVNRGFAGEKRMVVYPSSITAFIICGLILLTILKHHFESSLMEAFRALFSFRRSIRLFEEHRETDRQATILSNMLFAVVAGIFISLTLPFMDAAPLWGSYTLSVLFFSFVVGFLYFLKARIWQALGIVFNVRSFSEIYIFNMYLYNRNTGLLIFPLMALVPYVAFTVTVGLMYGVMALVAILWLLRQWRNFQIIRAQNVSVFYFILYLCTLEILPLLLVIKGCKELSELSLFL